MSTTAKYQTMRDQGKKPEEVYIAAKTDGLGQIAAVKLIRALFDLTLSEAKEISIVADGLARSLSDHQQNLAGNLAKPPPEDGKADDRTR